MSKAKRIVAGIAISAAAIGCGDGGDSIDDQIDAAMRTLPAYRHQVLSVNDRSGYLTMHVGKAGYGVDIAVAARTRSSCPPVPQLPHRHRRGQRPIAASSAAGVLCWDDDSFRPGDTSEESLTRLRIVGDVAEAVCEEVASSPFACAD